MRLLQNRARQTLRVGSDSRVYIREAPSLPGLSRRRGEVIDFAVPYLAELTSRLASGIERLPEQARDQHRRFFWSRQLDDGGFVGRGAESDLYYTAFALRALAILGDSDQQRILQAVEYLRQQSQGHASVIDLISLVFAAQLLEVWTGETVFHSNQDWKNSVAGLLEDLRRADGGYAKSAEGNASSTYQTFLVTLTYQLLELELPDPQQAVDFVLGQQREDGGFVEISVMRRSGVNPTAAAVGVLRVLGQDKLTRELGSDVAEFLCDNLTDEGGVRANTRIPVADLLSTYTGLQTLQDIGAGDRIERQRVLRFVESLQQSNGGFLAAELDDVVDVEYSFYGLGCLGLLNHDGSV